MQVAFTTRDGKHVNAHFGWANQIDLYEVTPEGYRFCKTLTFGGNLEADGNEDKLVPQIPLLPLRRFSHDGYPSFPLDQPHLARDRSPDAGGGSLRHLPRLE